ncbi:MAG: ABC transporter ATP-binding protein/permease [Oscillospiraceae bacterium]|nr:ABC transporter ATP-binding protein/permease [Oscillospiraceae bacterium]
MFQIKWLWHNLKGYRVMYIMALCFSVVCQGLFLIYPIFGQTIVDTFISSPDALKNLETKKDYLIMLCLGIVLFTLFRTSLQYLTNILYEKTSQGMIYKIRNYLYENVQRQDMRFYDRNRTGDLMTRLSGDLDMVRHAIAWIVKTFLEALSLFVISVVYFFMLDPLMALCLLALTPAIFFIALAFRKKVGPMYVDLRERLSILNTAAQENISGNRVVKAFAREDYEIKKFGEKNKDFSDANKNAALTWLAYFPYLETTCQALGVVMLFVGGIFVMNGRMSFGEFAAFNGMIWTIANPMRMFGSLINDLQRFMASANKIIEVYYARPIIIDRPDAVDHKERFKGEIEFKNVSFKYDNTTVLENISFKINPGETVAIMGETGSGKTSLVNLIPRFYDATSGEVLVDGINVRMLKLSQLRGNIGMATQDVLLFSDTIDGNIAFGNSSMPEDEVKQYAKLAAADEFISKMQDGYETIIGERGVGLSGGQKQRISLARALAIKPAILILDDTTSAVDLETEKYIQESLKSLDFPCTKIIIAQRISSTKDADKIIILKDGKIAEIGTHDELLRLGGYYSEVFSLQNEGFEKVGA